MQVFRSLLFFLFAVPVLGCAGSEAEQCEDLERYLEGREAALERACQDDDDCVIAWLRPGVPAATSQLPADPHLERAQTRWAELCGEPPVLVGSLQIACQERRETIPDPEAPDQMILLETLHECALRGDWRLEMPEASQDGSGDR